MSSTGPAGGPGGGPGGGPADAAAPEAARANVTPAEVVDEERVLSTVRENLLRLKAGPMVADHSATLVELRDSLSDEKLPDDIASIMEQMDRTQALMLQQAKSAEGTADPDNPYFGRMVLRDDHGQRTVLIGRSTFLSDRVRIVDWRNAPISRLFYQYSEGDEYDEELNGRMVSGEVLVRRTTTIAQGTLRRLGTDDHTWVRHGDGSWHDVRGVEARLSGGARTAIRPDSLGTGHGHGRHDKHLPEIASLLDPAQFELITRRDAGLVVIQGSAGSGKTTVGLHRIAWLAFQNPALFRPDRMVVVVFSKALGAYISQVLPALGVDGVKVVDYLKWASRLRMAHYKHLPEVYSDETPAVVTRFKTSTALLRMIDALGQDRRGRRNARGGDSPTEVFEELLTDHSWIEAGLERWAPGDFTKTEIERIHRWCTRQSFVRDEGKGDNEDDVPTLDREDDPILLRLWQVLKGPLRIPDSGDKKPLRYDHIMVDEAQDMAPIDLAVLIGTSGEGQSVTLAGDTAQKVHEHREFPSWTEVLDALRLGHVDVSPLQVSYRSTRQIMEVARAILGPLAPNEPVTAPRDGAPVGHLRFDSKGAAATWLAPALTDLVRREPTANVAVLAVDLTQARDWYGILERSQVPNLSLVAEQDFAFAPGIEVTDIRSSKGLEFDYVVLVGVDMDAFPPREASRYLLHVGATRRPTSSGSSRPARPPCSCRTDSPGSTRRTRPRSGLRTLADRKGT
ncbi:MAG: AAA family ATPase [Myxococcota bacterium]